MGRRRKPKHKRKSRPVTPPQPAAPASSPAPSPSRVASWLSRWGWLVVAAAAVLLRGIYFGEHRHSPFFHGLVLDAANYDAMGWSLAQGEGFSDGVFTFNPLAPLILGGIYALGGHDLAWPRLVLLAVDAAAAVGVYAMTRAVSQSWRAALAAGLLAAAYRPSIFYAGELLAEGWVLAFAVGGLTALCLLRERWWGLLLAGLGLGLATLGRPNILLFFPALLLWWAWELRAAGALARRAAPLLLGVGLVLGPFTARNLAVGGDTVLITAHGGINLFIGNNPDAIGWFSIPKGTGLSAGQDSLIRSATVIAEREAEREGMRPSEVSRHWQRKALRFFAEQPREAATLMAKKAFYFVNAYEKPMVANVHYAATRSVVIGTTSIGYALVLLLSVAGMISAWPQRRRWAPLYLFALTYSAGVVLFFVSMRYRLPVAAALLPFAGQGVVALVELAQTDRPKLAIWALGLFGLGIVVAWPSVRQAELPEDMAHTHYYLGGLASDRDEVSVAMYHYEAAREAAPDNPRYKNRLARVYLANEREAEGIALLESVIASEPYFLSPYLALGSAYRSQDDLAAAERVLRQAVRYGPRYHYGWNNLGNVLMDQGKLEEAEAAYAAAVEAEPTFLMGYQGLDRVYTAQGRRGALRPHLERAAAAGMRHRWLDETLGVLP